mmetsp:Transcript_1465/g.2550  ORF Transcript_1465/g.2550 Transcript_1465/m.2550 type:complete len:96 (-) Transcript_1465:103-390(-)
MLLRKSNKISGHIPRPSNQLKEVIAGDTQNLTAIRTGACDSRVSWFVFQAARLSTRLALTTLADGVLAAIPAMATDFHPPRLYYVHVVALVPLSK